MLITSWANLVVAGLTRACSFPNRSLSRRSRRRAGASRATGFGYPAEVLETRALLAGAVIPSALSQVSPNPRNTAVDQIDVTFSAPIDGSSFDAADVSLTLGNGPNLVTSAQTFEFVAGNTWRIGNLGDLTDETGSYKLTVVGAGVLDQWGAAGSGTRSVSWRADFVAPTVKSITVPKPSLRGNPFDALSVVFSETIQPGSFDLNDAVLSRDGQVVP